MTVIAVTMVRDESDVIETVVRHLCAEDVDRVIVADNLSTDDTPDILARLAAEGLPVTVTRDDEPGYYQARKMTRLARRAAELGADWVLPFDADEIWYAPDGGTIAETLARVDPLTTIVRAPGWDHIARGFRPLADDEEAWHPPPFSPWRRERTQQMAKVAFRAHPDARLHMGNHDVDRPGPSTAGPLAFRHFQYRSLPQMVRKLRNGREAYEASDIHPMHGTHWREGGAKTDDEIAADWAGLCAEEGLIFDPAPIRP